MTKICSLLLWRQKDLQFTREERALMDDEMSLDSSIGGEKKDALFEVCG
jgi:hypothetical protein